MAKERRVLLVVEDDPLVRRSVTRWIRRKSTFEIAETESVSAASAVIGVKPIGMIIDIGLPDGNGLDLAENACRHNPTVPILLITGSDEAAYINRAHILGLPIVRKPDFEQNLNIFLDQLSSKISNGERNMAYVIEELSFRAGLSPQQRKIIELMSSGATRAQLASVLGLEETTIRTHVRGIVRRVGVENLDRVGWRLLQLLDMRLRRSGRDS
jgi:DNA-binding NarL/FixJ family response regulator